MHAWTSWAARPSPASTTPGLAPSLRRCCSYLDEQGIDLLHSDHHEVASTISQTREGSVFVLTSDQRERYLARLDPSQLDGAVLRRYYEEFNETAAEGVDYAMLDGIAFLRDTLAPLDSGTVAVFMIG